MQIISVGEHVRTIPSDSNFEMARSIDLTVNSMTASRTSLYTVHGCFRRQGFVLNLCEHAADYSYDIVEIVMTTQAEDVLTEERLTCSKRRNRRPVASNNAIGSAVRPDRSSVCQLQ